MSRPRPLALLSIAVVAATAGLGMTAASAASGPVPSPSPTFTGTAPPTPFPSPTFIGSPTPTSFPSPSPTFTPSPTPTFSPSPTPTPSPSPTITPTPVPCVDPGASPPADPLGASAVQDQTQDVGTRIKDLVDQNGYAGFTGLIADPDHAGLILCWLRGDPLPGPIASIVANPGQPIHVTREDSPYAYADLASRADPLVADDSLGAQIGGTIHTVVVPEEGTGLSAGVQPDDPSTFDPGLAAAILSAAAGVPVTVSAGPAPEASTRLNDTSPWFGGGRLTDNVPRPVCSSGFGMVVGRAQFLLTARHCGVQAFSNGQLAGAGRQLIGNVTAAVLAADSEAISIAAPGVAGSSIYTGGVNDATEGSIRVNRVGVNIRNQFVCTSGSFSGEHCRLQIRNTALFVAGAALGVPIRVVGPLNLAVSVVGGVAAGGGDSGGPVAQPSATSLGAVSGMGTINGGFAQFPCVVYDARRCSTNVIYNHLGPLLRAYGGALA